MNFESGTHLRAIPGGGAFTPTAEVLSVYGGEAHLLYEPFPGQPQRMSCTYAVPVDTIADLYELDPSDSPDENASLTSGQGAGGVGGRSENAAPHVARKQQDAAPDLLPICGNDIKPGRILVMHWGGGSWSQIRVIRTSHLGDRVIIEDTGTAEQAVLPQSLILTVFRKWADPVPDEDGISW